MSARGAAVGATTRIGGTRRTVMLLAWSILVLAVLVIYAVGIPARYDELSSMCIADCAGQQLTATQVGAIRQIGLSLDDYAGFVLTLEVLLGLVFTAVAVVIVWRTPNDWMALFVSAFLLMLGLVLGEIGESLAAATRVTRVQLDTLEGLFGWSLLVLFFYLFPNGRFVPRWSRVLIVIWLTWWTLASLFPSSAINPSFWPTWAEVGYQAVLLWVPGVLAQVYRYRSVSTPVERQQTKWIVLGLAGTLLAIAAATTGDVFFPNLGGMRYRLVSTAVGDIATMLIPVTMGLAVLRYGLWNVDPLVNRTLVYGTLTAMLLLMYASSVVLLQGLFRTVVGQESQLAIVLSTLGIAALFAPLRQRIQRFIDRHFYRRKYDAQQVLAAFAETARDETDLDQLTGELLRVVDETMQPAHVSLWLRPAAEDKE